MGDLALLGTATGRGTGKLQEVWLVRRVRLDGEPAADIEWVPTAEVAARAGGPELQDADTVSALAVAMRSELLRDGEPSAPVRRSRPAKPPALSADEAALFLDEDLSVLEFQFRVLAMAEDPATPLLERLNFISIVSSNLDEFYMVNAGALKRERRRRGRGTPRSDRDPGPFPAESAAAGARGLSRSPRGGRGEGRDVAVAGPRQPSVAGGAVSARDLPAPDSPGHHREPGFPVPLMPQLTVLMAIMVQDVEAGPLYFAYLRFPERVPRFLPVPGRNDVIPLEEVVRANLALFYPGREIEGAWLFRLTRAAELDLEDEDAGNLLQAVEESVGRRALNAIVRVEVERAMPQSVRERLLWELRFERGVDAGAVGERDLVEIDGMLDPRGLRELLGAPVPGGRFPLFEGRNPWPADADLWAYIRERDRHVQHPQDSFTATVVRFFNEAADDPAVLAIRLTLYRIGERSPIVDALMRALQHGKEVAIFVELKARFDETRNIGWVRRLEEGGATVVFGVVGLKNHAKVGLVIRREPDGLRRYVHVSTGNYNALTARFYTDLGLFSADEALGADVHDLFNQLTGSSRAPGGTFRRIAVAPESLLPWLLGRIEQETAHARAGRPARIRAKLNGLADTEVIQALYGASRAGVSVDLVVRGLCTLRPGIPGHSDRIRVVSRLGRFLEHGRIYHFANGGAEDYFIGSADWRPRNLRRRIEVVAPVTSAEGRAALDAMLTGELSDPHAWVLRPDGTYEPGNPDGET